MDLLVYVQASSMRRLHEIREYIDAQTDIIKLKTHVVMSEWIGDHEEIHSCLMYKRMASQK